MRPTAAPIIARPDSEAADRSHSRTAFVASDEPAVSQRWYAQQSLGEIFRQKPKTAPSCSTYSVEGAMASRTIGFSRILRPCSGRLLRVLRSPGARSAGERTHGTDGSTLSWRLAGRNGQRRVSVPSNGAGHLNAPRRCKRWPRLSTAGVRARVALAADA
jgi:hypothetical protein